MRTELQPSAHALDVMNRRGVSWAEVIEVCERPAIAEPIYQGRQRLHRGALCVVVAEGVVVTVLLRESRQWTDEDARRRQIPD